MNEKIYPLAYMLAPGQACTLYYLGFPEAWKETLLKIAQENSPRFKDEYGLPTIPLKKLVESWLEGVIALAPLKKGSQDERWLTSCHAYTKKDLEALCDMLRVWVKATYVTPAKAPAFVKKHANDFCNTIKAEAFVALQSKADICLTREDGAVCEQAYQAIPLLAVNRLLGQEILLNAQPLRLCYAGKNQLISCPIADPKSRHQYSFVFDFSVQTTPPQRKALLLCHMSIRRWIPGRFSAEEIRYLPESVYAHIKVSESKYCQVPIAYDAHTGQIDWKQQHKECYNIWAYAQLPEAGHVLLHPEEYAAKILLPYQNGMRGFTRSKIGTGVSVLDKASLHGSISGLLGDMLCAQPEAKRIRLTRQSFSDYHCPQEYGDCEQFRSWVSKCAETDQITFELYGLWNDAAQRAILTQLKEKLEADFGENTQGSCLEIQYSCKETGDFTDRMPDDKKSTKIQRCEEIVSALGKTDAVTACIFVIPGQENYAKGDPKQVLRNAFARTGRVVQFITPDDDSNPHKIEHTVYDLYRQLGVVTLIKPQKTKPRLAQTPCVGMHVCTQLQGISSKGRFLPLYVTVDVFAGKTQVHCDAFPDRTVSYRKACLEMAQLFWAQDLEDRCKKASYSPAKQKLIALKNEYQSTEACVLFLVQADGNTRALWSGISDKEISGYAAAQEYCPAKINVGTAKSPYLLSLQNSGVRIVRIRSNAEAPDYFTGVSAKSTEAALQRSSASGIFGYHAVFWAIHDKPNDLQYTNSFTKSKIDYSQKRFAENDMVELYPLQLQAGDAAAEWIFYTNALRRISIQYDRKTILPLPLHLAKALEEYLFDPCK